jgi:hypothetical protein
MAIIKITPDKNGRAIATLYGKDFDLTEMADESGKGTFKAFSKEYEFQIVSRSTSKRKAIAVKDESVEEKIEVKTEPEKADE